MQGMNHNSNPTIDTTGQGSRQANKSILADSVAKELNLPRRTATLVIEAVLASVSDLLQHRGKLTIKGFGTFERKIRKGRSYTHPLTRESIYVADKETIMFRVSEQLNNATRSGAAPREPGHRIDPNELTQFG